MQTINDMSPIKVRLQISLRLLETLIRLVSNFFSQTLAGLSIFF